MRTNLIKDLSPKSKVLEQLCKAFVQRAHKIPCIITFHEVNKINKQIVSAHQRHASTFVCYFRSVCFKLTFRLLFGHSVGFESLHVVLTNVLPQIVSERSATIGVANEHVVPITGDHLEICRIKDENERAYQIIVQECQELGSAISDKHRSK